MCIMTDQEEHALQEAALQHSRAKSTNRCTLRRLHMQHRIQRRLYIFYTSLHIFLYGIATHNCHNHAPAEVEAHTRVRRLMSVFSLRAMASGALREEGMFACVATSECARACASC